MKKWLMALLALVMLTGVATAEEVAAGLGDFAVYQASMALPEETVWEAEVDGMIQSVAPEEGVTVSVCLRDTQIAVLTVEYLPDAQSDAALEAVRLLGFDEEVMAQIAALEEDSEINVNGVVIGRVCGETREALYVCLAEAREEMLWMPVHGGDQIHDLPRCSGMDVARMITPEIAAALGYDDCDTCRAEKTEA